MTVTVCLSHESAVPGTTGAEPKRPSRLVRLQVMKRVKLRRLVGCPWPCGPTGGA